MVPNDSSATFCGFSNDLKEKDGTISTALTSVLSLYVDFKRKSLSLSTLHIVYLSA